MGLTVLVVVDVGAVGVDEGGVGFVECRPVGASPQPCQDYGKRVYYYEKYEENGNHYALFAGLS